MASITTKQQELLQYIDTQVAVALQPWTAPIYCSVAFTPNPKPDFSLSQLQFSKQDIVSYMKQPMQAACLSGRLYFDPSSYTVDSVDQLAFDLTASARENGFELIRNGRNSSNSSCTVPGFPLRFRCSCMRVFRPSSKASTPSDYRPISFHNDRAKNSRGRKGKNGVRKAESKLPTSQTSICHFGFQLLADHHGIFIKVGFGKGTHTNHAQLCPSSIKATIRTINQKTSQLLGNLASSGLSAAHARNVLHQDPALDSLSYKQIYRYFSEQNRETIRTALLNQNKDAAGDGYVPVECDLLTYLRSRPDICCCIYGSGSPQVPNGRNFWVFSETRSPGKPNTIVPLEELCPEDVGKYRSQRKASKVPEDECAFVGGAWCTVKQKRLLLLDPSVIKVDATSHTNNEKRDLLTFSARVPSGQYFICLQVFMPNNRPATFRWIFQCVMPDIFGKHLLQKVKYIMTDGDSHEIDELVRAIPENMPWVRRGRCTWHIIRKGYDRRCPGPSAFGSSQLVKDNYRRMQRFILTWAYTWMYAGYCEHKDEFIVSACTFQAFLDSTEVLEYFCHKQDQLDRVKEFFRCYVFHLADEFAFYPRKFIRHYDEATNSSHEGTNLGLKNHAAAVLPSMSMAKSAQTQMLQADVKASSIEDTMSTLARSHPTWTATPTCAHILPIAESLLHQEEMLSKKYLVRTSGDSWKVVFNYTDFPNESSRAIDGDNPAKWKKLVPKFRHVRSVTKEESYFKCSCGHFQRFGIPCRHLFAVAGATNNAFCGFTHHDLSVVWLRAYNNLAYRRDHRQVDVAKALEALSDDDVKGPFFETPHPEQGTASNKAYDKVFEEGSAIERCMNYDKTTVMDCVRQYSTHLGSRYSASYLMGNHENMATFRGEETFDADAMFDSGDCDSESVNNEVIEEEAPGSRARRDLMPLMEELLKLHEAANVQSSAAPYERLMKAITDDIETLRGTIAIEPEYSMSQLSESQGLSQTRWHSIHGERETKKRRTYVATHGFQLQRKEG